VNHTSIAESSLGLVEIEFGVNRWVMVTVRSESAQQQIGSERELVDYLRARGLLESEARGLARTAWKSRPRAAGSHLASPDESLVSATGLRPSVILAIIVALVVGLMALLLYIGTHWPDDPFR
jgi:hypothetical protein